MSSPATMAVPAPHLRRFTDPARPGHRGEDLGVNVYEDRDAWLAARAGWAAGHGITVAGWFEVMLAEMAAERCTLGQVNEAFSRFIVEEDDWTDPRLPAALGWAAMGLTPVFRPGSREHDVLAIVKRRGHIGPDAARRRALARLIDWGLVTAGSGSKLTAEGTRALARLERGESYSPPPGQDKKAAGGAKVKDLRGSAG
jgi:hypothetical protein